MSTKKKKSLMERVPVVTAISNFPERDELSPASPSASVFTIRLTYPRHAWGAKLMEPINESDAAKHAASSNQWEGKCTSISQICHTDREEERVSGTPLKTDGREREPQMPTYHTRLG